MKFCENTDKHGQTHTQTHKQTNRHGHYNTSPSPYGGRGNKLHRSGPISGNPPDPSLMYTCTIIYKTRARAHANFALGKRSSRQREDIIVDLPTARSSRAGATPQVPRLLRLDYGRSVLITETCVRIGDFRRSLPRLSRTVASLIYRAAFCRHYSQTKKKTAARIGEK